MRFKKITALIFAAALGLAVLTACTEQSDGKETASTAAAESSVIQSETEKDCCHKAESCCENSEKSDCCKEKEHSEESSKAEKSCCHKESNESSIPDCCKNEESSEIPDCCGG